MWARKYKKCINCGTTSLPHRSKGLCTKCYQRQSYRKHSIHPRGLKIAAKLLTKSYLIEKYHHEKLSPTDIAKICGCTRQYVFKMLKHHDIPRRSKHTSRRIALEKGKIHREYIDESGSTNIKTLVSIKYNTNFFRQWTKEMAYVLGILFTDGCLSMRKQMWISTTRYSPHLSIAQKEQEILLKILKLLDCNCPVYHRGKKIYGSIVAGEIYWFDFDCTMIYPDLVRLGLKTKKSLDIQFPDIPQKYVRHFMRGCWDGDGTVYKCKGRRHISAGFFSGSLQFISDLLRVLVKSGLSARKIYIKKGKNLSYYFKYHGQECITLFHYLYDGVPESQYLTRKFNVFKQYVDTHEPAYSVKKQSQLFDK
jgi:hypothetical protein